MSSPSELSESRQGFAFGVAAYAMWGLFPLYWPLLKPAGALEILGHRIWWSVLTMVGVLLILRRTPHLIAILRTPRARSLLLVASVVITVNWGTFIWGVNHDHVVDVSLGYFINPLVTVLLGVFVLGERLLPLQWAAITLAGVAVVGLTVDYGRPPWVALLLAFSFGTYGLVKKQAGVQAVESLTFETLVLAPVAGGFLIWLGLTGRSHFTTGGLAHPVLMILTGVITAVPLLCFGAAAIRTPLTTLGLLQYIAPTIQFLIGLLVLGESMTPVRWVGFILVWVALALFTAETIRQHRRRQWVLATEGSAV